MPKSPAEILSDPNFHALPLGEQFKVMQTVDPNFAALPAKEQGTVIAKTRLRAMGLDKLGEKKEGPGFFGTLGKDIASIPGMVAGAVMNTGTGEPGDERPPGIIPQVGAAAHRQFEQGRQERAQGNYVSGAGHTLAGAIPVIGPFAAGIGEEIGEGQYGAAAAHTLELAGPEALKALPNKYLPKIRRTVGNVNNPKEEAALKSVEKDVRMTPGQRSDQSGLQTSERNLRNTPGTASEAEKFYTGQEEDLAKEGRKRIGAQGGQVTNPFGAGSAVRETLATRVRQLKTYADKLYDSTRQTTARNAQVVQTGTKTVPGPNPLATLTPAGMPRTVPVMTKLESPVALGPVRTQLKSVYSELARNLPEAKRANSPAYRALDELMNSDIQQMNAMDFDKFLGAVKSITRNGTSEILSNQSQRLARQVISAGEKEFQNAIAGAGPNVVQKLQNARKAVREYHDTADFLEDLDGEPGALYSNLTTGGDRVLNSLKVIGQKSPKALQTVGRTYLEQMMNKATNEGGFGRSAGVKADWERLGPETKKLIFGPQIAKSMDEFLLAAKRLTPAVGSPTADRLSAISQYGDVGKAIVEFVTGVGGGVMSGHPMAGTTAGTVAAGATLYASRLQPGVLARLTFKPKGAELLNQAIRVPVNSVGFNRTMQTLNAMAADENQ